jgi:hypothetical protein
MLPDYFPSSYLLILLGYQQEIDINRFYEEIAQKKENHVGKSRKTESSYASQSETRIAKGIYTINELRYYCCTQGNVSYCDFLIRACHNFISPRKESSLSTT